MIAGTQGEHSARLHRKCLPRLAGRWYDLSMSQVNSTTETAILSRAFQPFGGSLSPEAAQSILEVDFPESDKLRLKELLRLAQSGELDSDLESELENYRRAGRVLELLKSKARISLKNGSQ